MATIKFSIPGYEEPYTIESDVPRTDTWIAQKQKELAARYGDGVKLIQRDRPSPPTNLQASVSRLTERPVLAPTPINPFSLYERYVAPRLTKGVEKGLEFLNPLEESLTPGLGKSVAPWIVPQTGTGAAMMATTPAGGRMGEAVLSKLPRVGRAIGQMVGGAAPGVATGSPEEAAWGAGAGGAAAGIGNLIGWLRRFGPGGERRVGAKMATDVGEDVGRIVPDLGTPRTGQELFDVFGTNLWKQLLSSGYGRRLQALAGKLPQGLDTVIDAPILQQKLPPVLRDMVKAIETTKSGTRTVTRPDKEYGAFLPPTIEKTVTTGGSVKSTGTGTTSEGLATTTREPSGDLVKTVRTSGAGITQKRMAPLTLGEAERRLDAISDLAQWGSQEPTEMALQARRAFQEGKEAIRQGIRESGGSGAVALYDEMNAVYRRGRAMVDLLSDPSLYKAGQLRPGLLQRGMTQGASPKREDLMTRLGPEFERLRDTIFRGTPLTHEDVRGTGPLSLLRGYFIPGKGGRMGISAPREGIFPHYVAAPGRAPLEPASGTKDLLATLSQMGKRRRQEEEAPAVAR